MIPLSGGEMAFKGELDCVRDLRLEESMPELQVSLTREAECTEQPVMPAEREALLDALLQVKLQ